MIAVAENTVRPVDFRPMRNAVSVQVESTEQQQDLLQILNARAAVQPIHRVLLVRLVKMHAFARKDIGLTATSTLRVQASAVSENGQIFLVSPVMINVKNVHLDDSIQQLPRERSNFKDHVMESVTKGDSVTVVV